MAILADELKQVPLFSSLTQRQLKRLSRDFRERTFVAGTTPVREGHLSGIGFFVITEGEASVSINGTEVARLGPGDGLPFDDLCGTHALPAPPARSDRPDERVLPRPP